MNHSGGQVAKKRDTKESNKMTRSVQQQQHTPASQNNIKPAVTDPPAGGAKRQPTAEEKRLAEILHGSADGEARKKMIEEIQDITGCTTDEVVVALHDCNDDMEKAVTALLERDQNEDEDAWEHAGKKQDKKKKVQPVGKQNGNDGVFQGGQRERDGDREDRKPSERREKRDRSDGPPRPRRDRAPRFQRGDAARNNGEEQPDANGEDNESRSRSRRGRGGEHRYCGKDSSSSRGRSTGGRSFRNSGGQGFGTWSNENTVNAESKAAEDGKQGSWGEATAEDWDAGADDWTGTLTESKVFMASSARDDTSKPYAHNSGAVNGGDSGLFGSSQATSGQTFTANSDSLSGYQQQQQFQDLQGTAGQGQLGQRIHLADLMGSNMGDNSAYLRTGQAPGAGQQYAHAAAHLPGHFANQFNKQAEESIKTAVGISGVVGRVNTPDQAQLDQQASDSQQRAKAAKSRLPPPSKIPTTAVVMPGGSTQLDVNCEFGFWDASGDQTFSSAGSGMKLHSGGSSVLSQLQGLDGGVTSSASHDQTRTSHYQNTSHSDMLPRQDGAAYSSAAQGSYGQQRSAMPAATVAATSAAKGPTMFSASDFSTSYQPSSYKVGPSTGYNVSASNLSSAASYQTDYSATGADASSASQLTMPSYLSGASSQSVSQSNSVVGSGVFAASSQASAPGGSSKMYSGNALPSYANDQTLYHSQQLTNNYGGQSGLSYDSQSYQSQQSGLGYQSSAGNYSSAKQQVYSGASSTSSASAMSLLNASSGANNMADGFAKLGLKDTNQSGGLDLQQQQHYGGRSPVVDSSAASGTSQPSSSAGNVHADSVRSAASSSAGVTSVTSSAAANAAASRSASSTATSATKVPVTAGPSSAAVPMMQYGLVGQTGMQGIPHLMPTVYTDEYALMQPRTMMTNFYDMSAYQQPSTTLAGRDQSSIATVLPYTVDTKSGGRVDDNSPGSLSSNQQQQQLAAHQQAYLNPNIPPGYNTVFYPSNMITPGGYYNPAMFQLPAATNTAAGVHLGGASGAQLPKYYTPSATGYGDVSQQTQVQDYSKMYMAAAQTQTKAPTVGMTSDLTSTSYGKPHSQTYDKGVYGTSPPYNNLPMAQGGQAATMAAPAATAYRAQYGMPVMPHSQLVPHMQQQDMRGGQQLAGGQMKATGKYNTTQYWTGN